jgi:flagellin FlaB
MVKNMKNETKNENRDDLAAIGIGAMIVFIALILVAAVASAVIIQTAEKLQQNAQEAGEGTKDAIASKVIIINAIKGAGAVTTLTLELAPGSDSVAEANVAWLATCTAAAVDQGDMAAVVNLDGSGDAGFEPNEIYSIDLTLTNCGALDTTLYIQAGGSGTTYEVLNLEGSSQGELVV